MRGVCMWVSREKIVIDYIVKSFKYYFKKFFSDGVLL